MISFVAQAMHSARARAFVAETERLLTAERLAIADELRKTKSATTHCSPA
jgi:hypothetical protein